MENWQNILGTSRHSLMLMFSTGHLARGCVSITEARRDGTPITRSFDSWTVNSGMNEAFLSLPEVFPNKTYDLAGAYMPFETKE